MPDYKITATFQFTVTATDRDHAEQRARQMLAVQGGGTFFSDLGSLALHPAPAGWTSIDAGHDQAPEPTTEPQQADGHTDRTDRTERQTVSQGPGTKSPERPFWLTFRYHNLTPYPNIPGRNRTMHFSSAAARTAWIAGLSQFATITGQGDDIG